jgi:hypothetical protein
VATKEEIIATIRQGIDRVERTFGKLTDEQLATQVHSEEAGWTARDILTHLAGRAQGYDLTFRMAEGTPMPSRPGGFDVNAWNQSRIAERAGKTRDELLAEVRAVHEALIARVQEMPDEQLERTIPRAQGPVPVSDALRGGGGMHAINHTIVVEKALGLDGAGD